MENLPRNDTITYFFTTIRLCMMYGRILYFAVVLGEVMSQNQFSKILAFVQIVALLLIPLAGTFQVRPAFAGESGVRGETITIEPAGKVTWQEMLNYESSHSPDPGDPTASSLVICLLQLPFPRSWGSNHCAVYAAACAAEPVADRCENTADRRGRDHKRGSGRPCRLAAMFL